MPPEILIYVFKPPFLLPGPRKELEMRCTWMDGLISKWWILIFNCFRTINAYMNIRYNIIIQLLFFTKQKCLTIPAVWAVELEVRFLPQRKILSAELQFDDSSERSNARSPKFQNQMWEKQRGPNLTLGYFKISWYQV